MASNTLFVSNFPFSTTEDELRATFAAIGSVSSIRIILDRETGRSRGFAFVEMEDAATLDVAIESLNETEFHGRRLVVSKARGRAAGDAGGRNDVGNSRPSRPSQPDATSSPFRHRIVVDWNDDDELYVATVPDLGLTSQGATIEAAIRQVQSRARESAYSNHGA